MKCPRKDITFSKMSYELGVDCKWLIEPKDQMGYCKRPEYFRCIEDIWKPVQLSASGVKTFLTCRQLYYLQYIRGIYTRDSMKSPAVKMGALWDACVQKLCGEDVNMGELVEKYEIGNKEIAKVKGIYRAAKELDIDWRYGCTGKMETQKWFSLDVEIRGDKDNPQNMMVVNGIMDRYFGEDGLFVESKFSSRPDNYLDLFFIQSQVGTYFLADPGLKHVIMEVVRTPALRSTGRNNEETDEEHEERVFQDAITRPSWYFIGWNGETRTFGKKFARSEFDLDEVYNRYRLAAMDLNLAQVNNAYYKNDAMCIGLYPGIPCDMLGICRYNTVAENVYGIRDIPKKFTKTEDVIIEVKDTVTIVKENKVIEQTILDLGEGEKNEAV